jgi:hypothetical protein
MSRSGWKHGFVAVLIGIVLGAGGLAGQPAAQAAPSSGVNSEGGYSEGHGCRDCFSERPPCAERAERRCGDCYDRQPRCGDCYDRQPRCGDCAERRSRCGDCYDRQPRCSDCYERQELEEQADYDDYE